MRAFILALALSLPLGLAACADSPQEEAIEEGAPPGDQADVIGDGEIIDEPGEPDADELGDGFTDPDINVDMDGDVEVDMDGDGM